MASILSGPLAGPLVAMKTRSTMASDHGGEPQERESRIVLPERDAAFRRRSKEGVAVSPGECRRRMVHEIRRHPPLSSPSRLHFTVMVTSGSAAAAGGSPSQVRPLILGERRRRRVHEIHRRPRFLLPLVSLSQ